MDSFNYYNKEFLLSLKPKYYIIICLILISIISIVVCLFIFKTYDVYSTRGYITCEEKCHLTISVDTLDTNKISNIDYLVIDDKKIIPKNISISDVKTDEATLSNYQIVNYEFDQIDYGINTFTDAKLYFNNETIIRKIKKLLL